MSTTKARHEALRWLGTAEEDLKAAGLLAKAGMHAHACFQSQQAGEKAMKAVWFGMGGDPWGHSVLKLVQDLPDAAVHERFKPLADHAAILDKFYIPTRYPNGLPDLTPAATYRASESENGILAARTLFEASCEFLQSPEPGDSPRTDVG